MPFAPASIPQGSLGFILPTFPQDSDPWSRPSSTGHRPGRDELAQLARWCRSAEDLGAGTLWACDHVFWHGPCLECMVSLTVAATATDRVGLGTCVMQLPLRRASVVAKQATTLQVLSGGRFTLGVGVGRHPGEYDESGVDYHARGQLLDDGIEELRRCWSSEEGSDHPALYRQLPVTPGVPVWAGGSSEAALRRAAQSCDGWMPLFLSVEEYRDALDRLAKEVQRAGRAAAAVTPAMVLFVSIDPDPDAARRRGKRWMSSFYRLPPRAFDRHLVAGTASEVSRAVDDYREAGAEHVIVFVTADEPLSQFERLVSVKPAVRATIGG